MSGCDLEKQDDGTVTVTTVIDEPSMQQPIAVMSDMMTTIKTRDFDPSADPIRPRTGNPEPMMYPMHTRTRSRRANAGSEPAIHIGDVLEKVPTALQPALSFLSRIHHFTFAWYTVTYGSACLSSNPLRASDATNGLVKPCLV